MTYDVIKMAANGPVKKLKDGTAFSDMDVIRKNWQPVACMLCGACCCSSVIPIAYDDVSKFYERLGLSISSSEFDAKFLQDTGENAINSAIETEKYAGRCMFLSKREEHFECSVWERRADVCSGFFCWEMVNFEKWLNGEDQDIFDSSASFEVNFAVLVEKLLTESSLSVFPDDMLGWTRLRNGGASPSHYEKELKK